MAGRSLIAFALVVLAAESAAATLLAFTYSVPLEQTREGRAPTRAELLPSVEAAFTRESYAPGDTAKLVISNRAQGLSSRFSTPAPSASSLAATAR